MHPRCVAVSTDDEDAVRSCLRSQPTLHGFQAEFVASRLLRQEFAKPRHFRVTDALERSEQAAKRKEHSRKNEEEFQRIDVDRSGQINLQEWRVAKKKNTPELSDEEINEGFMKLDADGDGALSLQEYRAVDMSPNSASQSKLDAQGRCKFIITVTHSRLLVWSQNPTQMGTRMRARTLFYGSMKLMKACEPSCADY